MNERSRRLWVATEAHALGHGGITIVHQAIGMDIKTIRRGLKKMNVLGDAVGKTWTVLTNIAVSLTRLLRRGERTLKEV